MANYTVIGVYDEDGQVYCGLVENCSSALDAMIQVAESNVDDGLQILGAIEGNHQIVTPSDETGNSAYAVDLREIAL